MCPGCRITIHQGGGTEVPYLVGPRQTSGAPSNSNSLICLFCLGSDERFFLIENFINLDLDYIYNPNKLESFILSIQKILIIHTSAVTD